MINPREFKTPEEFIAWVKTQSADVQKRVVRTVKFLMETHDLDEYVAAHVAYILCTFDSLSAMPSDTGSIRH